MKVVVTGALGHIGSAVLRKVTQLDGVTDVIAVDNLSSQRYVSLASLPDSSVRLLPQDAREVMAQLGLGSSDVVVHLAAIAEPQRSASRPQEVFDHNFATTQAVVRTCTSSGARMIFASSTSVYSGAGLMSERTPAENLRPVNPYSRVKLMEEAHIRSTLDPEQYTILRLGTVFGISPGVRFSTAVNRFCWQAALGESLTVYSNARAQLRPYLGVDDAASVIADAVVNTARFRGLCINVASEHATVEGVLDLVRRSFPNLRTSIVDAPATGDNSFSVTTELAESLGVRTNQRLAAGVDDVLRYLGALRNNA